MSAGAVFALIGPASADVSAGAGVAPAYYGPPPGANCDANARLYGFNHCGGGYYGPPVVTRGYWDGHWQDGHFFYDDRHPKG